MKLFKQKETYLSEEVKFFGDIDSQNDVTIDGAVTGNVRSKGCVMLGETAHVEANIESESAVIYGYFKGTVTTRGLLEIKTPATIIGDLVADALRIDSGTTIQGTIVARMVDHATKTTPAASTQADLLVGE